MSIDVETFTDGDALAAAAGERLIDVIGAAIAARGRALIVLTGGGNGIRLLSYLRTQQQRVHWPDVHLFWGDERYVAVDHDDRNEKQAREALLNHIDIPPRNVHAMPASDDETDGDLAAAALAYEQVLAGNAEPGQPAPNFDVHLLGVGPEGHINSLFPETPAVREKSRLVVSVEDSPKPPPKRITLTLPAVRRAREVWTMVSGAEKADAVAAAIAGADPVRVPAAGAVGRERTVWFLDKQAASKLG
ncbi:6-phosphogluconolactonase [Mycobacterium shimoidei]|uniref:6-phosphogluconolactonase n=1 Tax=Mycobacterium shimoidei TaxID=29313 RepID=UPI000848F4F8|nr:6-phosphogluconolactonase [Mycobacterium shimoidei]MCV7258231.1 6-phosphogluconolactonase [Mycobacterium shimoidei]ODR08911.1 6-phosphogluconolactonase [Mycobacterium shimoidei]ORW82339.1 6-phosphogluconolactonase [Mycobacterium shimoidei]